MNLPFIPALSASAVAGIDFAGATPFEALQARFDAFDASPKGRNDPSCCQVIARLASGVVFWSAKLAVDADGTNAAPLLPRGTGLDPEDGQDDTAFHFPDGRPLASALHPYFVLPLAAFRAVTGLALGDLAVVIYGATLTAAICGDLGPHNKLGEGSIALHEAFHDPCSRRDPAGHCLRIRDVSIPRDVLTFVFPNSSPAGLTFENAPTLIKTAAYARFAALGGTSPAA